MTKRIKVLLVEDNPRDSELVLHELKRAGLDVDWHRVDTEPEYLDRLHTGPDIILSDFAMPQFNGLQALELLKKSGLDIPFILVSGTIGEESAVTAIKEGASDYLLKDRLARLGSAVRQALEQRRLRLERTQLEEQLRQSQKMESIGQLAGGVAHDFNNILTVIQMHASLALCREDLQPEMADSAREIALAAERATGLTRQLLAFSRRQVLQPRKLDLNEVVEGMGRMLERILGEDIEISFRPEESLPLVQADAGMMDQILLNLAVNSRDAMPKGGKLLVSTCSRMMDPGQILSPVERREGRYVCLSFQDTGCGISREHMARIFEPFFTTKEAGKGTGLGLATVYGIVKQHNGWVEVESEEGRGTLFRIYLPATEGKIDSRGSCGAGRKQF
jgi:two-component system cell cycle sensor histidine kinase/response regulator CckA